MTSAAFDVLGIGNAIVDVFSHADEAFLKKHALVKGATLRWPRAAARRSLQMETR